MSIRSLSRRETALPTLLEDFFRPWNEWFDGGFTGRALTIPAVNVTETKKEYALSFAVPGMKKEDFHIDVEGNVLTVSAEKETTQKETEETFTRKEYNFSSFRRTFTLPEEVHKDKIQAGYSDGVLKLSLPKKEEFIQLPSKSITVR